MPSIEDQTRPIIDILRDTHEQISNLPTTDEFAMVKSRVLTSLSQHINRLSTGIEDAPLSVDGSESRAGKPLRSIFGRKLNPPAEEKTAQIDEASVAAYKASLQHDEAGDNDEDKSDQPLAAGQGIAANSQPLHATLNSANNPGVVKSQQEQVAEELQAKVSTLYPQFISIETKDIVATYSDLEIRGIGKMAGLPVTETSPAKADAKFVNQVKAAIQRKMDITKTENSATSQEEKK